MKVTGAMGRRNLTPDILPEPVTATAVTALVAIGPPGLGNRRHVAGQRQG